MHANTSYHSNPESVLSKRILCIRANFCADLGLAFMGLAGLAHWLDFSDPTVPFIATFFLIVGLLVFVYGLALHRKTEVHRSESK